MEFHYYLKIEVSWVYRHRFTHLNQRTNCTWLLFFSGSIAPTHPTSTIEISFSLAMDRYRITGFFSGPLR